MAESQNSAPGEVEARKSREVIESYIFSTSSRKLSIYSERLLMRIVEIAQRQVAGVNFRDGADIGQVSIGPLGEANLEIPIRGLLGGSTNYAQAKRAVMELMSSPYYVERPKVRGGQPVYGDDGAMEFEFIGHQILNDCNVNVKPGVACVSVNRNTWQAVLDFSRGFRKFDMNAAMLLTKSCSARLFRLVSNQSSPMTYSIAQLRKMWLLEDKYRKTSDFVKRTIVEAKEELDAKAPWSFDYKLNFARTAPENKGRSGHPAVTSVTFFPVRKAAKMSAGALINMVNSPLSVLGRELYELLLSKFEFTVQGIRNKSAFRCPVRQVFPGTLQNRYFGKRIGEVAEFPRLPMRGKRVAVLSVVVPLCFVGPEGPPAGLQGPSGRVPGIPGVKRIRCLLRRVGPVFRFPALPHPSFSIVSCHDMYHYVII